MPSLVDSILKVGLVAGQTFVDELRGRLLSQVGLLNAGVPIETVIRAAREIMSETAPLIASLASDIQIAGWVAGLDETARSLPKNVQRAIAELDDPLGLKAPKLYLPSDPVPPSEVKFSPVVEFPWMDEAINRLIHRNVMTRDEFDEASDDLKSQAFTIANIDSEETIGTIRDLLAEHMADRDAKNTPREFYNRVVDKLGSSPIGMPHLETVFRTNTTMAYSASREAMHSSPVVQAVFPYAAYWSIRDGRARQNHRALEKLGLNGTNVYRADDPMWKLFTPPWDFN